MTNATNATTSLAIKHDLRKAGWDVGSVRKVTGRAARPYSEAWAVTIHGGLDDLDEALGWLLGAFIGHGFVVTHA